MLQFLPLEILHDILHRVLYPENYLGYYLDIEEGHQWAQMDGINFAATCRILRQALIPKLWEYTSLSMIGYRRKKLPMGFKLFPDANTSDPEQAVPFLSCFWDTQETMGNGYMKKDVEEKDEKAFFFECPTSMDSPLKYVKVFKLSIRRRGGLLEDISNEYMPRKKFALALSLVNPQTMPLLRDLILQTIIDTKTSKAYIELGRALGTFENKINLTLLGLVDPDSYACDNYDFPIDVDGRNHYSFIALIHDFGWSPFVVNIQAPSADCNRKENEIPGAENLYLDVQGLRHRLICCSDVCRQRIKFTHPFTAGVSKPITYFNLSRITDDIFFLGPQFDWIPSTVRILKCRSSHLMDPMVTEEQYQHFDNVHTLTIEVDKNLTTAHTSRKYFFRNLTELQVIRGYSIINARVFNFFDELCILLSSNKQSLKSLKIDSLFREEFELVSPYFNWLETLDYCLRLRAREARSNSKFISSAMWNWSQNLRQLSYVIKPVENSFSQSPGLKQHIDYDELRFHVLKHPNLQFNAVKMYFPDIFNNRRRRERGDKLVKRNSTGDERLLFGNTFKKSRDSERFTFTDFCEVPDPNLFAPYVILLAENICYAPTNFFMDFTKLRALIKKSEEADLRNIQDLGWFYSS